MITRFLVTHSTPDRSVMFFAVGEEGRLAGHLCVVLGRFVRHGTTVCVNYIIFVVCIFEVKRVAVAVVFRSMVHRACIVFGEACSFTYIRIISAMLVDNSWAVNIPQ